MQILRAASHINQGLTKAWLSMAVEVTIMRYQNPLMKIRINIDQKDTTVEQEVISMFSFQHV